MVRIDFLNHKPSHIIFFSNFDEFLENIYFFQFNLYMGQLIREFNSTWIFTFTWQASTDQLHDNPAR